MPIEKIIVTVVGVFLILFIVWFFWGTKNETKPMDHEHMHH